MSSRHSSDRAADATPSILDIVFSCGICQATLAEVYATKEHTKGFPSGTADGDGVVTKFWIGACCHTFCAKHLPGGGLPFHSQDSAPRAVCPVCITKGGGGQEQDLFSIRGLAPGQYDQTLPEEFMECPPKSLSGDGPDSHAMRFQYHQMLHYAQAVTKRWKSAEKKQRAAEKAFSKERKEWRTVEAKAKAHILTLEKSETKLQKWEQRRDMINHYLGLVNKMAQDIKVLRTKLRELGFTVSEQNYAFQQPTSKPAAHDDRAPRYDSAATLVGEPESSSSSHRKRKHAIEEQYVDRDPEMESTLRNQKEHNRAMMPPPPLIRPIEPLQRPLYSQSSIFGEVASQNRQYQLPDGERAPFAAMNGRLSAHRTSMQQPLSSDAAPEIGIGMPDYQVPNDISDRPRYEARRQNRTLPFRTNQRVEQSEVFGRCTQDEKMYAAGGRDRDLLVPSALPDTGLLSMPPRRRCGQQIFTYPMDEEPAPRGDSALQLSNSASHLDHPYNSGGRATKEQHNVPLYSQTSPVARHIAAPAYYSTPTQHYPPFGQPSQRPTASPFFQQPPLTLRPNHPSTPQQPSHRPDPISFTPRAAPQLYNNYHQPSTHQPPSRQPATPLPPHSSHQHQQQHQPPHRPPSSLLSHLNAPNIINTTTTINSRSRITLPPPSSSTAANPRLHHSRRHPHDPSLAAIQGVRGGGGGGVDAPRDDDGRDMRGFAAYAATGGGGASRGIGDRGVVWR